MSSSPAPNQKASAAVSERYFRRASALPPPDYPVVHGSAKSSSSARNKEIVPFPAWPSRATRLKSGHYVRRTFALPPPIYPVVDESRYHGDTSSYLAAKEAADRLYYAAMEHYYHHYRLHEDEEDRRARDVEDAVQRRKHPPPPPPPNPLVNEARWTTDQLEWTPEAVADQESDDEDSQDDEDHLDSAAGIAEVDAELVGIEQEVFALGELSLRGVNASDVVETYVRQLALDAALFTPYEAATAEAEVDLGGQAGKRKRTGTPPQSECEFCSKHDRECILSDARIATCTACHAEGRKCILPADTLGSRSASASASISASASPSPSHSTSASASATNLNAGLAEEVESHTTSVTAALAKTFGALGRQDGPIAEALERLCDLVTAQHLQHAK